MLTVAISKRNKLQNIIVLTPKDGTPRILSLEEALDFIDTDELLEVTPQSLRIRKKILDSKMRKRGKL